MITYNNKEFRNLAEQVQYLSEFHEANQGIAQWGIRVIGRVEDQYELPNPATYKGEYGDAFAVGLRAPYFFFIFTRPAVEGGSPYWFPFGEISIVGPQGPKGDQGEVGLTGKSTKWYIVASKPLDYSDYEEGDMFLILSEDADPNNGSVYLRSGRDIVYYGSIQGPQGVPGIQGPRGLQGEQGPQGEKGETGAPGAFIKITGVVSNKNSLPTEPFPADRTEAYLVGTAAPYTLYIQVGPDNDREWVSAGRLNTATQVTVGGAYQNTWNADTKLDKVTGNTTYNQVYMKGTSGNQMMANVTQQKVASTIVQRKSDSNIAVPAPVNGEDAVNKTYVDRDMWIPSGTIISGSIQDTNSKYWDYQAEEYTNKANGKKKMVYELLARTDLTGNKEPISVNLGITNFTLGAKYRAATIPYSALPATSWSGYWSFDTFTFDEQTDIASECALLPYRGSGGFEVKVLVVTEDPKEFIIFGKARAFVTKYER